MMKELFDVDTTSVAGFTMAQTQVHFEPIMAQREHQEQSVTSILVFRVLQEEQRYNLHLLEQHRLLNSS